VTSDHSIISVLVVEDEALTRLDLVETLRTAGYDVLEASNASEAFGFLQSGKRIDVVITDIQLGGSLTGWDVAERFRAVRPDIPIVYTSGNAVDHARKVAGSVFFGKPCRTIDILRVCRTFGRTASTERRAPGP
jgi:two-component system, response regulator PdtaR